MKVLIAYYSETGNTEKIAQAIHEEAAKDHKAELKQIHEITIATLSNYDLVFLGAPCHDADLARPVKQLLEAIPSSPKFKLAGFFTHATWSPGKTQRSKEMYQQWAGKCSKTFESTSKEKHIDFLGYFHCQGAPSKPIEAFIRREIITSDKEWQEYLPDVRTHPTPEDLETAKIFVRTTFQHLTTHPNP
jgi:flavodoxin